MSESADLVSGMYEAFGRGDVPAILEKLDENIEWSVPENLPHGGDVRGRDGVGGFFQGIGEKWDGLSVEVESLIADGDRVVVLAHIHGKLRSSGDEAAYEGAHVWTVQGGTAVRFNEYVNAPLSLPSARD